MPPKASGLAWARDRAFVTGAGGFAGRHLALRSSATERVAPPREELDLRDADAARALAADARRTASSTSRRSRASRARGSEPERTHRRQRGDDAPLLEAVRHEAPDARVLIASTGEVYGPPALAPGHRGRAAPPQNPYALSKAACDLLAGQYADAHGLTVVRDAGLQPRRARAVGRLRRRHAHPAGRRGRGGGRRLGRDPHRQPRPRATSPTCATRCARTPRRSRLPAGAYNVCSGRRRPSTS